MIRSMYVTSTIKSWWGTDCKADHKSTKLIITREIASCRPISLRHLLSSLCFHARKCALLQYLIRQIIGYCPVALNELISGTNCLFIYARQSRFAISTADYDMSCRLPFSFHVKGARWRMDSAGGSVKGRKFWCTFFPNFRKKSIQP